MSRPRRPWDDLGSETRARYQRAGLDRVSYERGDPIPIARTKPPAKPRESNFRRSSFRPRGRP